MRKITVTLDLTPEQLKAVLDLLEAPAPKDLILDAPQQYLRAAGDRGQRKPGPGRPLKLNEAGLKKLWELHKQGLSCPQIAKAFGGLIHTSSVLDCINKIKAAKS